MFVRRLILAAGLSCLGLPVSVYAAAQLAAGATTSARVTATNPQLRQIQMTFDPAIAPLSTGPFYNVTGFSLSLTWDSNVLTYVPGSLQYCAPFSPVTYQPVSSPGQLKNIAGEADPSMTSPGDVDLFSAWYQLQPNVPANSLVSVTVQALDNTDFIEGGNSFDPGNPQLSVTSVGPNQIQPATATGAVGAVPLPAGVWGGLVALSALVCTAARKSRWILSPA